MKYDIWATTQGLTTILIFLSLFFLLCIGILIIKLQKKEHQNHELSAENQSLKLSQSLSLERFADMQEIAKKSETEKNSLNEKIISLERNLSATTAEARAKEESYLEKISSLEKIKQEMTLKFKDISAEIIRSQHETFSTEQKNTLSSVIAPLTEQLKVFKQEVSAARDENIKSKAALQTGLSDLKTMNLSLTKEAQNLTDALKGSKKAQGCWGECQLNRILEISGLRLGQDYETQQTLTDETNKILRPDVIIHLPENRDIIIDSKVSLNDYLESTESDDEGLRLKSLQKNASAIKSHIDELSAKEYQKLLKDRTLNYVIMFIPIESAYIAALDYDRYIYDYAYKKNIILATPLSLLPTLRTIENLWKIDNQNQNVRKIAELGGKIYDKLAAFVDDMKTLERGLNQATNAYTSALTKLQGRGGALSQAEKMKLLGAKTNKTVNLTLNDSELPLIEDKTEPTNL